ncbi:MAG: Gp15 family bacteriophage protein [Christensenellaceae bacterium]|jgi:hypothetical protein
MNNFSLSRNKIKAFPNTVEVAGSVFLINADYRVALKIFRIHGDGNVQGTSKVLLSLQWFYSLPMYCLLAKNNGALDEVYMAMMRFLVGEPKETPKEQKQEYCFEFDAQEIYASFLQQYGIDIVDIDFLHWYKFSALFAGLGEETPFVRKVIARTRDTSKLKGEAKALAEKAKKSVALPDNRTSAEVALEREITRRLKAGEPIDDLLGGEA